MFIVLCVYTDLQYIWYLIYETSALISADFTQVYRQIYQQEAIK